jgi:competence protein ComEA
MLKRFLAVLLALSASFAFAAVDVNIASVADLDSIKGIGPGTSSKIVDARKSSKFKDWGDFIARVPGIGDKRAVKLSSEGLTVNGEVFKGAAAAAKPVKKAETVAAKESAGTKPAKAEAKQ